MILPENILTPIGNLRGALTSGGLIPGMPVIIGTASGNPAHFEDGTNNPLIELIIEIEITQTGSGDPTPNNRRPIIGWTGAEIHVADGATPHIIDNEYNISWDDDIGEVYGGRYNVTTGELAITWTRNQIKDYSWTYHGTSNVFRTLNLKNVQVMSEIYKTITPYVSWSLLPNNSIECGPTDLIIKDLLYNDAAVFKAARGDEYIYHEITPIIYNIPPKTIFSILNENNINSDTGYIISCKYVANIETFLQWIYDNLYNP